MNCAKLLAAFMAADQPVLLMGAPGSGKTSAAIEAAGPKHAVVVPSAWGDDILGIPTATADGLRWHLPPWVADANGGTLILDEVTCAAPAQQAQLLRVVLERRIHGVPLNCRVVATGNPADTAADGGWLAPAMRARFAIVDWTPSADHWIAGELGGWGRPDTNTVAGRSLVASFIRRQPALLDPDPKITDGPVRCRRQWSAVARIISGRSLDETAALAAPLVGADAAGQLLHHMQQFQLPDPESILNGAELPTRGDLAHAALGAAIAHAVATRRFDDGWNVISRARPDICIAPAKALLAADKDTLNPVAIELANKIALLA